MTSSVSDNKEMNIKHRVNKSKCLLIISTFYCNIPEAKLYTSTNLTSVKSLKLANANLLALINTL